MVDVSPPKGARRSSDLLRSCGSESERQARPPYAESRIADSDCHCIIDTSSHSPDLHLYRSDMAATRIPRPLGSFVCNSCRHSLALKTSRRAFTTSQHRNAEDDTARSELDNLFNSASRAQNSANPRSGSGDQRVFGSRISSATQAAPSSMMAQLDQSPEQASRSFFLDAEQRNQGGKGDERAHRLHVLATKHNTHLTFVQPQKPASQTAGSGISSTNASAADQKKLVDVLLSLSAGNIGFRKAGRGSYDAAYQLTAFMLKQIQEKGMLRDIKKLDVIMRGFGAGREAVTKVLLGSEGRNIRDRISSVKDATRLKIGGNRSPKPRRLG